MSTAISFLLALAPALQDAEPSALELRAALDALREGSPGETAFESALPRLPDLIRSRSGWFVAGGAYLAGEHGRKECTPALVEALDPRAGLDPQGVESVLDALIRLDARVPPNLLDLGREHAESRVLLLARDPASNRDALLGLFDALDDEHRARWAAACALASIGDPRIAERLIAVTKWSIDAVVRPPGSELDTGRSFGGSYSVSSSSHPRWPPRVAYHLSLPTREGELLPIRFERVASARSLRGPAILSPLARTELRARLLRELLPGDASVALLRDDDVLVLAWTDAEGFERALRAHVDELRGRIARAAAALEAQGLLAAAQDVAARATIGITLHDLREQDGGSLPRPEIPGVVYD